MTRAATWFAICCIVGWPLAVSAQDVSFVRVEGDFEAGFGAFALAAGDVNGDGHRDVVVANNDDDSVAVLLGDSTGFFAAPVLYPVGGVRLPSRSRISTVTATSMSSLPTSSTTTSPFC